MGAPRRPEPGNAALAASIRTLPSGAAVDRSLGPRLLVSRGTAESPVKIILLLVVPGASFSLTSLVEAAGGNPSGRLALWMLLAATFLGAAALAWIRGNHTRRRRVDLFESGLVFLNGDQPAAVVTWDAVDRFHWSTTVLHRAGRPETRTAVKIVAGDATFTLTEAFDGVERIAVRTDAGVTAAMLPKVLSEIDDGRAVAFGPLAIDATGVHRPGERLAWREVDGIRLHDGRLLIDRRGGRPAWAKLPVGQIPNVSVLLRAATTLARRDSDQQVVFPSQAVGFRPLARFGTSDPPDADSRPRAGPC